MLLPIRIQPKLQKPTQAKFQPPQEDFSEDAIGAIKIVDGLFIGDEFASQVS